MDVYQVKCPVCGWCHFVKLPDPPKSEKDAEFLCEDCKTVSEEDGDFRF